jgi:hypothetical protein
MIVVETAAVFTPARTGRSFRFISFGPAHDIRTDASSNIPVVFMDFIETTSHP